LYHRKSLKEVCAYVEKVSKKVCSFTGKVSKNTKKSKNPFISSKQERKNLARQLRQQKIVKDHKSKAKLGTSVTPPFLVAIVPVSRDAVANFFFTELSGALSSSSSTSNNVATSFSPRGDLQVNLVKQKQRFVVLRPLQSDKDGDEDVVGILDAVKAATTVLFLYGGTSDGGELYDDAGKELVAAIRAQGLPTCVHVVPKVGVGSF
jgi:pre-rRNA-processing protein TSR1